MPLSTRLAGMPGGKVRPEDLLGYLTMYSIPERMVAHALIDREWDLRNLDASLKPAPSRALDTFALACNAVATARTNGAGESVLVKSASTDGKTYQITRELRDDLNRVVEYPKAMTFQFDPNTETMTVFRREDFEALRLLEHRVRDNYRAFKHQISGRKVRGAVRDVVLGLHATSWFGKGAYVVPKAGIDTLETLQDFLSVVYRGTARMSLMEVFNTDANKEDLAYFHAGEIHERAETLMAKIAGKLKEGGAVREDMLANVVKQHKEIIAQRDTILEMVGRETRDVEDQLDVLRDQVEKLVDLADEVATARGRAAVA